MQPLDEQIVGIHLALFDHVGQRVREPLAKFLMRREQIRHEEMHQRPEFHQRVLQRRAGEKQTTLGVKVQQRLPTLRFEILDVLRFVENEILPFLSTERFGVLQHEFVRGDADVKGVDLRPALTFELPFFHRAVVGQNLERGTPFLELQLPVEHHTGGNDDQMWTPHFLLAGQMREQGNGLNGLAETHLISEDTVQFILVERVEPIEPDMLIFSQRMLQ